MLIGHGPESFVPEIFTGHILQAASKSQSVRFVSGMINQARLTFTGCGEVRVSVFYYFTTDCG